MNDIAGRLKAISKSSRGVVPGLVAAGALVVLLAANWVRAYHASVKEDVAAGLELHRTYSEVLARGGESESAIAETEKRIGELEKGLLSADKPSIGAAELQEAFKKITARKNIDLDSEKALSSVDSNGYTRVPIEFRFTAGFSDLREILGEVDSSRLIMGVRSIRVASQPTRPGTLDVTLILEGALRKAGGGER